jgi:TPR repeat protein
VTGVRGRGLAAAVGALLTTLSAASAQSTSDAPATAADDRLLDAIAWYTGVPGHVDDARARALLLELTSEPGAGRSDALSFMWLARVYSRGRMGFERDEERARAEALEVFGLVRALAAEGDVEAAFLMGTAYDEALGVEEDFPEAMRWYLRAARQGHVLAMHNVGNMHRDGRGVTIDHGRAARWWLRAARAGDVIPALRLGEAYEAGRGVPVREALAVYWYDKAAAAGNAAAAEALRRIRSEPRF